MIKSTTGVGNTMDNIDKKEELETSRIEEVTGGEDGDRRRIVFLMYCSHCQKEFRQPAGPGKSKCPYCGRSDALLDRGIA